MNFKPHVKTKEALALRAFTAISRLASIEEGLSYQALHQLFQTCVATVSDFRAEVWWNGQVGLRNILQGPQNQAIREIAGAFRTIPTATLEADTAHPPTSIRLNEKQKKYALLLLSIPSTLPLIPLSPEFWPNTPEDNSEDNNRS